MVPCASSARTEWPTDIVVGYHHVTPGNPDREGFLLAMKETDAAPEDSAHFGDQPVETVASRAAGVLASGRRWGLAEVTALRESKPDHLLMWVEALHDFLLPRPSR
jgi:phosphoglycolate phosphatase-like HAD superfamily hydrolase